MMFYGGYLLGEAPKVGQMFNVHALPEPIHEHHPEVIVDAPLAIALAMGSLQRI